MLQDGIYVTLFTPDYDNNLIVIQYYCWIVDGTILCIICKMADKNRK